MLMTIMVKKCNLKHIIFKVKMPANFKATKSCRIKVWTSAMVTP